MENITKSLSSIVTFVTDTIIPISPTVDNSIIVNDDKDIEISQTELALKYKESIIQSINDDAYEKRVPVPVVLENLSIKIKGNKTVSDKIIVHPFNAYIEGASLFAILGGSGSGKTTLLNVIANRVDKKSMIVDGNIKINRISSTSHKVGYVTQADFLLPFLTVRETLTFTAKLKMTKEQSLQRDEIVDSVITDLGLKEVADSLIGDEWHRGLSGGEKRRVSIAIQIISNPAVLCLDEPTSGSDAFTAQTVTQSLLRLCKGKRQTTVTCSVHQPRSDVFYCFDSVLLLSKGGKAIYCGSTVNMINYFTKIGFPCPAASNPADYFVDLSSIDVRDVINAKVDRIRLEHLIIETKKEENFSLNHVQLPLKIGNYDNKDDNTLNLQQHTSWFYQVYVLTMRFLKNNWRNPSDIAGGLIQAFVMGIMIMGIFWDLADDNISAIRSRYGLSYIIISAEPYILMIILVQKYCTDLKVFDREIQDRLYHPSAYLAAHLISSFPQLFIQPFLYGLPIYYGCNMRPGYDHLLIYLAANILISFIINGIAWMSVSFQRSFSVASLIANMNFTFIGIINISYHILTYNIIYYFRTDVRILGKFQSTAYLC